MEQGAEDLVVRFDHRELVVPPDTSLSFGRDADLVIDADNQYLHRVLGVLVCLDGVWWLQNVGRYIPILVGEPGGPSRGEIAPGAQTALVGQETTVSFMAGTERYELICIQEGPPPLPMQAMAPTDTIQFGRVRLNGEQRLLVTALAEPLLRGDPTWPASMPSNREVAHRLGWTVTKFNRKLDYLCRRLASLGVSGLQGQSGENASGRRLRLVEHLVDQRAITAEDLVRLDEPPPDPWDDP